MSLYICAADDDGYLAEQNADRLGNVHVGKSCIRFKRLDDIDLDVVSELTRRRVFPPAPIPRRTRRVP